jgi:hypothetical protein
MDDPERCRLRGTPGRAEALNIGAIAEAKANVDITLPLIAAEESKVPAWRTDPTEQKRRLPC